MKRLLVISLLVVVVLAMTVGTAYASTCGAGCTRAMSCESAVSSACPMGAPSALGPSCSHPDQHQGREASVPQPLPEVSVLSATPAVAAPAEPAFASTAPAPDARGAPHLTAVIRI